MKHICASAILSLGLLQFAAASELVIRPDLRTIVMPVGGRVLALPKVDDVGADRRASFDPTALNFPLVAAGFHPGGTDSDPQASFENQSNGIRLRALFQELSGLEDDTKATNDFGETTKLSRMPRRDALSLLPTSDRVTSRLAAVRQYIVSSLLDARLSLTTKTFLNAAGNVVTNTLEELVDHSLSDKDVATLAGLLSVDPNTMRSSAITVLTSEIRAKRFATPQVLNPYNQFQSVDINDPVLMQGGQWRGSLDSFNKFADDYCLNAESYWTSVLATGSVDSTDLAMIKAMGLIEDNKFLALKYRLPVEEVVAQCKSLIGSRANFERATEIVKGEARFFFEFFFSKWPDDVVAAINPVEAKARRLAELAVDNLSPKVSGEERDRLIRGNLGTFEYIVEGVSLLYSEFSRNPKIFDRITLMDDGELLPVKDAAVDAFPSIIANRLASLQMLATFGHFLGGIDVVNTVTMEPPGEFNKVGNFLPVFTGKQDYASGPDIFSAYLRNPQRSERATADMQKWRDNWDTGLGQFGAEALDSELSKEFGQYWDRYYLRLLGFRRAVAAVQRTNDILSGLESINEPIGFYDAEQHNEGQVFVPADTTVRDVLWPVGTFVESGVPLFIVEADFLRIAKLAVSSEELASSGLAVDGIFRFVPDHVKPPSELAITAKVESIVPGEANDWNISLKLGVAVSRNLLSPNGFLPPAVPLSRSLCATGAVQVIDPRLCRVGLDLLPHFGRLQGVFRPL